MIPGITPCFECTLWLFPPQTKFPLCTLAETPRSPVHCIEYAKLVLWEQVGEPPNAPSTLVCVRPVCPTRHQPPPTAPPPLPPREQEKQKGEGDFDADNVEHMMWVFGKAKERADHYGIPGVTLQLTQGVVKNIIPAVASTNAIVAAQCTLEALKAATMFSRGMSNYMMYIGNSQDAGVYSLTVEYPKEELCPVCSAGLPLSVARGCTLEDTLAAVAGMPEMRAKGVTAPSLAHGATSLYMRGALEGMFRDNLGKSMAELLGTDSAILTVNDIALPGPLRIRVTLTQG